MESQSVIEKTIATTMYALGCDLKDENLKDTPKRIARMFREEFFANLGREEEAKSIITTFENGEHDEIIMFTNIPYVSLCPHHFLPYQGIAHFAYLPDKVIVGASKPERLITYLSKQPIIQEKLSVIIGKTFMEAVKPRGCMLLMRAQHCCMTCRGIQSTNSSMITSLTRGVFRTNLDIRMEALQLLQVYK